MKRIINNIKLYWLSFTKKNTCSLQSYYVAVKSPATNCLLFYKGREEWYEMALKHLGYGEGRCPEGFPKRTVRGSSMRPIDSHEKFYFKVLEHIALQEWLKANQIEFKQLSPLMKEDLAKPKNDHSWDIWYNLSYGLKRK